MFKIKLGSNTASGNEGRKNKKTALKSKKTTSKYIKEDGLDEETKQCLDN